MIKGILALFKTGIIFDPFVLGGIILGFFTALTPHKEVMETLFKQNSFYLLVLLIAFLYHYLLKKVYKDDGYTLDYFRMALNILLSLVKFVISCALSIVFVLMLFAL